VKRRGSCPEGEGGRPNAPRGRPSSPGRLAALLALLDRMRPPYGPCGICGGPDARHRLWDAIEGTVRLGGIRSARQYWPDIPAKGMRLICAAFDEARRRHAPLPGRYPLAVAIPPTSSGAPDKSFLGDGEAGRALPRTA
jgi:hypothetical protein